MRFWAIVLFLGIGVTACRERIPEPLYTVEQSVWADSAMVVSAHPLASEVGLEVLKNGGNAVDAAVAVQFALAVVYPRAGNIGGGGFLVHRAANGNATTLDYREKAPAAATRDMYLDSLGNVVGNSNRAGHLAAGVPGTVAGLWQAHQELGQLDWANLVAPAYQLAQEGFWVTETEAARLNRFQEDFVAKNTKPTVFVQSGGWSAGDRLVQRDLAKTLQRIMQDGRTGFYTGETADLLLAEMARGKGIMTAEDLKQYEAVWRKPIETNYKEYRLISMPPPSSGGIALAQLLEYVEPYPMERMGFQSPAAVHVMVEAERRAYADRAEHLGDADFVDIPLEMLLDSAYLSDRMAKFNPNVATVSDSIAAGTVDGVRLESFETTHTSIVDSKGNAVALTTTLNSNYGCKVMVGDAGFFLNNEMDDFSAKPGVPNQFGLLGAEANAIAPYKRMLSSMTPTIVEKNNALYLVLGTPGGSTIITSVFQVFLNMAEFGMDLNKAVQAPRFHHQWKPDEIWIEPNTFSEIIKTDLQGRGHQFQEKEKLGVVKAIHRNKDGKLHGVGDHRNADDSAIGY